jgi:hypothetical protein
MRSHAAHSRSECHATFGPEGVTFASWNVVPCTLINVR